MTEAQNIKSVNYKATTTKQSLWGKYTMSNQLLDRGQWTTNNQSAGDVRAFFSSLPSPRPSPAGGGAADAGDESGVDSGVLLADDENPSTSCASKVYSTRGDRDTRH